MRLQHGAIQLQPQLAVQAVEQDVPVLVAVQELSAPTAFKSFYDSEQPFSMAMLLTPPGYSATPLASVRLAVTRDRCAYPDLPRIRGIDWSDNFAARSLPLLAALATPGVATLKLPISETSCMTLALTVRKAAVTPGE